MLCNNETYELVLPLKIVYIVHMYYKAGSGVKLFFRTNCV